VNCLDFGRFLAGAAREKSSNCVSLNSANDIQQMIQQLCSASPRHKQIMLSSIHPFQRYHFALSLVLCRGSPHC
jgi:hypothetical protein